MSDRTLHVHLHEGGDVDVQGYLKFSKVELVDISNAILLVASRRPEGFEPCRCGHKYPHETMCPQSAYSEFMKAGGER